MKATDVLMEEHRVIERVLLSLELGVARIEAGKPVRPGFFIEATDFVKGFADGCHHKKEEGVLFKVMADQGMPVQNGPIGVMLSEHELGRAYTLGLREAAQRLDQGDETARQAVIENARGYATLLRHHILKEDNVLFPMADRIIPLDEQDSVWEAFEHIEHEETGAGVHEKYLALAQKLEEEIGL